MNILKTFLLITSLLMVIIISGCQEVNTYYDEMPHWDYFYVLNSANKQCHMESISIGAYELWEDKLTIVTTCQPSNIRVSANSWLTCTKIDNLTYTLTVTPNNSIKLRTGNVDIEEIRECNNDSYSCVRLLQAYHITQWGRTLNLYNENTHVISGYRDKIILSGYGGISSDYEVRADGDYTITKDPSDSWYTVTHSKENNTFYVTAPANPSSTAREGSITIALAGLPTGESQEIVVKVIQI